MFGHHTGRPVLESRRSPKKNPLQRRVPKNAKYEQVQSKVNSGCTVSKIKNISTREYLRRRDEMFGRVGPISLCELLREYEPRGAEGTRLNAGSIGDGGGLRVVVHEADAMPVYDQPYLLLDVRHNTEFATGRIVQAKNFPTAMISQDRYLPELISFKNKEETLIILYEDNERIACQAATLLAQKGFDNIYVLSGGFREFADRFPDCCEGELPLPPSPKKGGKGTRQPTSSGRIRLNGPGSATSRGTPTRSARGGPERSSPGSVVSSHRSGRNQNYSPRSNATSISRHIQQQSPGFGGRQSGRPQPMTARSSHSRFTEDDDMASVAGSTVSVAASVISRSAHQKRRFAN